MATTTNGAAANGAAVSPFVAASMQDVPRNGSIDANKAGLEDAKAVSPPKNLKRGVSSASSLPPDGSIPTRKLLYALFAISLGTMIEWYDFTVYSQMSKQLAKVFFPSNDPVLQALSFWGVFFVGYVSRPVGAILFGHLGDTKGRSTCLLISVLVMGIPTVLIGCLPTYAHVGIAAPVLLAILRLIQGLAMGGEFGAAMVYLHEIADPRWQSLTGSLGYISLGVGVVVGILMVIFVVAVIPASALLTWGWRVPFLSAIFSLVAGVFLRYNMPESAEFATSREEIDGEYKRRIKEWKARRQASRLMRRADSARADPKPTREPSFGAAKSADLESQASDAAVTQKHYVPLMELLRGHWLGILLQMGYEAWIAASFYLGYSWLPSFFVTHAGIPTMTTLWMVLSAMVVYTFVVPVAGYLADKGQRRVNATIVVCIVAAAMSVPMFLAFRTRSLAACWLLQIFTMCLTAYTMGVLPSICSSIFPAGIRISGFNLGYNMGMTVFGGCTPLIMTAIQSGTGSIFIGPGIWMTGMALITIACSFGLIKWYPLTNTVGEA